MDTELLSEHDAQQPSPLDGVRAHLDQIAYRFQVVHSADVSLALHRIGCPNALHIPSGKVWTEPDYELVTLLRQQYVDNPVVLAGIEEWERRHPREKHR